MNKKIIMGLVVVSFLLVGVVSAGLVPWLSNTVSADVGVKGPVFYATSGNSLVVNEYGDGENTVTYKIDNSGNELFWSNELPNITDFNYKPKMELFVKANLSKGEHEPKRLNLVFEYINSTGDTNTICSTDVGVNKGENYQELKEECEADSELKNVKKFLYRIEGRADQDYQYGIKIDGYTKAEITGIVN